MDHDRPLVFVGAATESNEVTRAIKSNLEPSCEVITWDRGFYRPGRSVMEDLSAKGPDFDFAVFFLDPIDKIISRKKAHAAPRDNVIFEMGFFTGLLGRDRVFAVCDRSKITKILSDYAGITYVAFDPPSEKGNIISSLGKPCDELLAEVAKLRLRSKGAYKISGSSFAESLHHVSLSVKNLKVSTKFYEKVLRLRRTDRDPMYPFPGEWFVFPSGQQLHLIENKYGTFRKHFVLSDHDPSDIKKILPYYRDNHFALTVKDYVAAIAHIEKSGHEVYGEAKARRFFQGYLTDPDGHIIEIRSEKPAIA